MVRSLLISQPLWSGGADLSLAGGSTTLAREALIGVTIGAPGWSGMQSNPLVGTQVIE